MNKAATSSNRIYWSIFRGLYDVIKDGRFLFQPFRNRRRHQRRRRSRAAPTKKVRIFYWIYLYVSSDLERSICSTYMYLYMCVLVDSLMLSTRKRELIIRPLFANLKAFSRLSFEAFYPERESGAAGVRLTWRKKKNIKLNSAGGGRVVY